MLFEAEGPAWAKAGRQEPAGFRNREFFRLGMCAVFHGHGATEGA